MHIVSVTFVVFGMNLAHASSHEFSKESGNKGKSHHDCSQPTSCGLTCALPCLPCAGVSHGHAIPSLGPCAPCQAGNEAP